MIDAEDLTPEQLRSIILNSCRIWCTAGGGQSLVIIGAYAWH